MEDSPFPRLYREAPVNAIWEGSGNVQCLDVLRAMHKTPDVVDALFTELARARGANAHLERFVAALQAEFGDRAELEYRARDLVDRMAPCWCSMRPPPWPTHSVPRASTATGSGSTARCRAASTARRSSSARHRGRRRAERGAPAQRGTACGRLRTTSAPGHAHDDRASAARFGSPYARRGERRQAGPCHSPS
jgi:hypothetical protein